MRIIIIGIALLTLGAKAELPLLKRDEYLQTQIITKRDKYYYDTMKLCIKSNLAIAKIELLESRIKELERQLFISNGGIDERTDINNGY